MSHPLTITTPEGKVLTKFLVEYTDAEGVRQFDEVYAPSEGFLALFAPNAAPTLNGVAVSPDPITVE